ISSQSQLEDFLGEQKKIITLIQQEKSIFNEILSLYDIKLRLLAVNPNFVFLPQPILIGVQVNVLLVNMIEEIKKLKENINTVTKNWELTVKQQNEENKKKQDQQESEIRELKQKINGMQIKLLALTKLTQPEEKKLAALPSVSPSNASGVTKPSGHKRTSSDPREYRDEDIKFKLTLFRQKPQATNASLFLKACQQVENSPNYIGAETNNAMLLAKANNSDLNHAIVIQQYSVESQQKKLYIIKILDKYGEDVGLESSGWFLRDHIVLAVDKKTGEMAFFHKERAEKGDFYTPIADKNLKVQEILEKEFLFKKPSPDQTKVHSSMRG
ncbi:MAG TPA: hypothetical protein VHZ76_06370, partial [Gammaproteobacteria bacterium]|nr:hypothetical protein [Gammaproteobacteria bacterium]